MRTETICLVKNPDKCIDQILCEIFSWSKTFYKSQHFPTAWSQQRVLAPITLSIDIACLNHGRIQAANDDLLNKVKILHEDESIVAIHKDSMIHSHPLTYGEENNVLSILRAMGRSDLLRINPQLYDRGLLYRLDFETSGLMLLAKDQTIYDHVRKNFHQVMKGKKYIARCVGDLSAIAVNHWVHYLQSSGPKGAKIIAHHHETNAETQRAELDWKLINYEPATNISTVEIDLLTGLRHQIRAQFSKEGYPLMGDQLYGASAASRIYLHAYEYTVDLCGKVMKYTAPAQSEFYL